MTDPTAEERIRSTFADLEAWGRRAGTPFEPVVGSDLHGDDQDWLPFPTSQLCFSGLVTGREHLQAVRVHIEAGELFPTAHHTLIRTAILGASQSVWMLAPEDRSTRVNRARTVAAEVCRNHETFLKDLRTVAGDPPHEGTENVYKHISGRRQELEQKRLTDRPKLTAFNATAVIEEAVETVYGRDLRIHGRVEWRRGSGAAHGLVWPLFGRESTKRTGEPDENGMVTFQVGGDLDDILNAYVMAHALIKKGWSLLDARSTP